MMAYNNGFPINYPQMYPQYNYAPQQPMIQQPTMQQNDNGILWVQGEAGAKSWAVAPGKSVMLMDSESNTFYIKSSDNSGMPMPLRIFDYKERNSSSAQNNVMHQPEIDVSKFVTWEDFDKKLKEKLQEIFVDRKREVEVDG